MAARHAPVDPSGSAPAVAHSSSVAAETFDFAHYPLEATIVGEARENAELEEPMMGGRRARRRATVSVESGGGADENGVK